MSTTDAQQIENLSLTHGQAVWILWHAFNIGTGRASPSFDSYIKYLRRAGIPFSSSERGVGKGANLTYGYVHLMELGLALRLRPQGILKSDVVQLIAESRDELRPTFEQAWLERDSGLGSRWQVGTGNETARGVWVDLHIQYFQEGGPMSMGPIKALGPKDAVLEYVRLGRSLAAHPPINLTEIAEAIIKRSAAAPEIRRGRS